jgi:hypothetical protein
MSDSARRSSGTQRTDVASAAFANCELERQRLRRCASGDRDASDWPGSCRALCFQREAACSGEDFIAALALGIEIHPDEQRPGNQSPKGILLKRALNIH